MGRLLRCVGFAFTGVIVLAGAAGGCATSEPADLGPDIDTTLPGVDASQGASPLPGGGTTTKDSGSASTDGDAKDAGGKPAATQDAAPVDAAPAVPKPAPGEVLITEIMYNTLKGAEPDAEWIELHNLASSARSLSGLTLKDGGARTHVIGAGVTIAPGAYVVLARDKSVATATALVPASAIVYEYAKGMPSNAGIQLANGTTGSIALLNGAATIANVPYGPWFSQSGGSSIQLDSLVPAQATLQASWCLSLTTWTTGSDKGTPGAASNCP